MNTDNLIALESSSGTARVKATPLGITAETVRRLLALHKPSDAIALYCFLANTASRQGTSSVKATVSYVARGLGWSASKVQRCKKRLSDLDLIEPVVRRDSQNIITGHFIRVKYLTGAPPSQNPTCGEMTTKCLLIKDEMLAHERTVACQRPNSVEQVLASGYPEDVCARFIHFNNCKGWQLHNWQAALKAFADSCDLYGASPLPKDWTPYIALGEGAIL